MPRCAPLLLTLCACRDTPADLGPTVLAVYLGNDTNLSEWVQVRAGLGVAVGFDLSTDGVKPDDALVDADVVFQTLDVPVTGAAIVPGVYQTPLDTALAIPGRSDPLRIDVDDRGKSYGLSSPIPRILAIDLTFLTTSQGTNVDVDLPKNWSRTYDHVVATVINEEGELVADTLPRTFDGWLSALSKPPRPSTLTIPFSDLPPGSYALGVHFLKQMDADVTYYGPIDEPVSGLWAGTAWLVPVEVVL